MSKAREERLKLRAGYLNGLAIALAAVGGIAPLFSALYGMQQTVSGWVVLLVSAICFLASFILHSLGQRTLKGLDNDPS